MWGVRRGLTDLTAAFSYLACTVSADAEVLHLHLVLQASELDRHTGDFASWMQAIEFKQ
jgi:hypothetical protein